MGLDHWDMTPKSPEDREILLALNLCRELFGNRGLSADAASVMYFAMLPDARPLARATLKNDDVAASRIKKDLFDKWSPRMDKAAAG